MEKIVHRYWGGPKPMPETYVEFGKRWAEENPDWEVIEWTPENLPPMRNQQTLNEIALRPRSSIPMEFHRAVAVQSSDVIYYELIEQFGGICLNVDIEPLRPLNDFLEVVGENAWATYEDEYYLVNCAYGGPKGHPFWKALNDYLPTNYQNRYAEYMQHQTGPHLLTHVWKERGDLIALPRETFNYVYHLDIPEGGNADSWKEDAIAAGAFGLHHWSHRTFYDANAQRY
jgi:mannosyltransferase OCH1-like enzyme